MNLYLDDDSVDRRLVAMLQNAGHAVTIPADVGTSGAKDTRHLIHAISQSLVLVTRNHDDFVELHEVIQVAHGAHSGILIIRSDNDISRDMTHRQIVVAIWQTFPSRRANCQRDVYIEPLAMRTWEH